MKTDPEGKVINLSKHTFSVNTFKLLNKGLKFCPRPPKFNSNNLNNDIKDFFRRIKLKIHFTKDDHKHDILDTLKESNKSFTPRNNDITIQTFELAVKNDIREYITKHNDKFILHDNLNINERKCLNNLKKNTNIIITRADKGGATVIRGIEQYLEEAYTHLNNEQFYKELPSDPFDEYKKTINKSLKDMCHNKLIDKKNS